MNYTRELEISKKAATLAGIAIMKIYGEENFKVDYKDDNSPLTEADKRANEIIVDILCNNFPDYAVLSEENRDDKNRLGNDYCFIVDPLDGTKEFIKRNGQFTVNIALAYQHKTVMGVIYVPVTKELYYAAEGYGSYYKANGNNPEKLRVSERTVQLRMVMSSSHSHPAEEKLIEKYDIKEFIKMGSSLKGCLIAKGDADIYYRFNPTMEWDTAAMQCIAEQAGAIFRQADGTQMLYNRENSLNDKGFYIINCEENLYEI